MKRMVIKTVGVLMIISLLFTGCTSIVSNSENKKIKETIDLVLSYDKGYDDTVSKYISKVNFNIVNYVSFYSTYLGDASLEKYESTIRSIKKENEKYRVCMVLNMVAKAKEVHGHEEERDEAEGENVPVEIVLTKNSNKYYIESFKEYESLDKAIENNKDFK
ncbi:hypothetical protein [Clostridium septicum]|uniref:Uncharacterized protein n=1 Tax=Clostridium septicum TaxID=1504 RepID=A0A9N7JIJ6_CLOSE|nr:hypothetical protein [Clostridium septicum]AYE33168.1 hypothetical protein CP523_01200 [Clostridium septicum]MDU1314165.1 hypothetical protein [Clostridium septicum]QAS61338.1 hypothetical protein EI377_11700 [Clostridium septicum]UEC22229.1 hypothetical protein LK444_07680 [Clostridium septicum]USR99741.1 hypothetical protein NH397_09505 [Clostridium septicum]